MEKELVKLFKQYKMYIEYWNGNAIKQRIKDKGPLPIDDFYKSTFTGFMKWLEDKNVK